MKNKTKKLWKLKVCGSKIIRYFDDFDYAIDFNARLRKYTGRHCEMEVIYK